MKIEFNKQRIIGIAIVVLFLLVAIPFLLAGNKKGETKTDENVALAIPSSDVNSSAQSSAAIDDGTVKSSATDNDSIQPESAIKNPVQSSDNSAIEDDIQLPKDDKSPNANDNNKASSGDVSNSTSDDSNVTNASASMDHDPVTKADNNKSDANVVSSANDTGAKVTENKPPKTAAKSTTTKKSAKKQVVKNKTSTKTTATTSAAHKTATISHKQTAAVASKDKKWTVRIGYHEKYESYKQIASNLHKKGYKNVYAKKMSIKGKDVVNIFVGPMASQEDAKQTADKLTASLKKKAVVIKMK